MSVRTRFREAFDAELAAHPDKAPGPTALARRMGWINRNLNGICSGLRIQWLEQAGFVKDGPYGRWRKTDAA